SQLVLEAMITDLRLVSQRNEHVSPPPLGVRAAGIAVASRLMYWGMKKLILLNRSGILRPGLAGMNPVQEEIANRTNPEQKSGGLSEAVEGADIFIGLSAPGVLTPDMVKTMSPQPIIFALAHPDPEIMPDEALAAGARVVARGRSDF